MSSHHIVRDRQEPALLIHTLEQFSITLLHELLEWSPTVVCLEPALDTFITQGHKVDFALVDISSLEVWKERLSFQQPVRIIAMNNPGLLMSGLTILSREKYPAVNILTSETCFPEVLRGVSPYFQLFDLVIYAGTGRYTLQRERGFRKWLKKGVRIGIFPLEGTKRFSSEGFEKNMREMEVTTPIFLITKTDGNVVITTNEGLFMIREEWKSRG